MRQGVRIRQATRLAAMGGMAVAFVAGTTGCETTGGGSQMENTVFSIHRKVSNMEGELGESISRLNENSAELTMRVQDSEAQTRQLTGMLQENQRKLAMVEEKLDNLSEVVFEEFGRTVPRVDAPAAAAEPADDIYVPAPPQIDNDNGGAASQPARTPVPNDSAADPMQTADAEDTEPLADEGEAAAGNPILDYRRAQDSYIDGDYEEALGLYDEFLSKYPQSDQALSALFWKGGSQMKLQRYSDAINTYEQLAQRYPNDTEKVPSALFNQAVAYSNTGNRTRAMDIMREIIQKYPGTRAAQRASDIMNNASQGGAGN